MMGGDGSCGATGAGAGATGAGGGVLGRGLGAGFGTGFIGAGLGLGGGSGVGAGGFCNEIVTTSGSEVAAGMPMYLRPQLMMSRCNNSVASRMAIGYNQRLLLERLKKGGCDVIALV